MSRFLRFLLPFALAAFAVGCRAGDSSACSRAEHECDDAADVDPATLAFEAYGYGSCVDAVDDTHCGIDAEALRRCVDDRSGRLCVPPEYQSRDVVELFDGTGCEDELETFTSCVDRQNSSSSSNSGSWDWDD